MTWLLVESSGGLIYESNPIAHAWLEGHGWLGLILFKSLAAGLVAAVSWLLEDARPNVGNTLLTVACAVLLLVIGYSGVVLHSLANSTLPQRESEQLLLWEGKLLDQHLQVRKRYHQQLSRLASEVAQGQRTLREAAHTLAMSDEGKAFLSIRSGSERQEGGEGEAAIAVQLAKAVAVQLPTEDPRRPEKLHQLQSTAKAILGHGVDLEP